MSPPTFLSSYLLTFLPPGPMGLVGSGAAWVPRVLGIRSLVGVPVALYLTVVLTTVKLLVVD
eukprot:1320494-Amorphochlora_amoeboformis.AAC.1